MSLFSTCHVLCCAAVILAFSLPKAYELKKPEIDDAVATGQARTKQLYDQHVAPHGACFNSVPHDSIGSGSTADIC